MFGLVPGGAPAQAAGSCSSQACVEIDVYDQSGKAGAQSFDFEDLKALKDVEGVAYDKQGPRDSQPSTLSVTGPSLNTLIAHTADPDEAGSMLRPGAVTYAEVLDTSGAAHPLYRTGDLAAPGQTRFEDGLAPAVYYSADGGSFGYIRPLRDSSDVNLGSDPNLNGYIPLSADQGPLVIRVHTTGSWLTPTIHAATTKPELGASVGFGADLQSAPPGVTYRWDFGDGTPPVTGARPTHAWHSKGTFVVSVQASADDGSAGRSEPLTIDVESTPTAAPSSPAGSGQDPDPGAPSTGPTKSNGKHHGGKVSSTPSQGATASPGTTSDTASGTTSATGSSSGGLLAPPSGTTTVPSATATASPTSPAQPTVDGVPVTGILLADADVPAPAAGVSATAPAARAGQTTPARSPFSLPDWVLPTVVCLLAFAAGGLRESRHARAVAGRLARGLHARGPGRMRP
ncbi:PKD domain-containing protein [Nocardioides sp. BP30]|uniref:PKD domain-containing protein n=1 Tax=Nocardioides sp. BP30 TaxID=3036374 RepID=UPI00246836D2|nr:PKD domain-containing protein [Nocardioides sp. BP30]WGL52164.1 PKD domain-containing protein [Nocardioides sp. BP30]